MLSPRRLQGLILAVTLLFAAALGWLGWRLLEQDRALARQRRMEQLEAAADRLAGALYRRLAELAEAAQGGMPPAGAVRIHSHDRAFEVWPENALLYHPVVPPPPAVAPERFAEAEELEFRRNNPAAAAEALRSLARSSTGAVRAQALARLGRNLRKAGRLEAALSAYRELAALKDAPVDGLPAELVAWEARCSLLEHAERTAELRREAAGLLNKLAGGAWRLGHAAWESQWEQASQWSGRRIDVDRNKSSLSAAVALLWQDVRAGRGTRILDAAGPVLAVWNSDGQHWRALVIPLDGAGLALEGAKPFRATLSDDAGRVLAGAAAAETRLRVERSPASTKLPWTLVVSSSDDGTAELAGRSWLLAAGFALLVSLLAGVGYIAARAVAKEMAVARLQTDFVAAVSHEFRSPLSSISQIAELLDEDRWPTSDHRRKGYAILNRESARLRRLVESLLDFARMEAGTAAYRLEPVDAAELVWSVVEEQREDRIELRVAGKLPEVRADAEALRRAVGNLVENALKYSAPDTRVLVEVERSRGMLAIRVSDEGPGIPAAEQARVFEKFYRGHDAKERKVKGTGIGLAMVRHIVDGHHGKISLESEPGRGTTFTILLPEAKER